MDLHEDTAVHNMPPDGSAVDLVSQSSWHSIRPWMPPLSLIVREITSVSATFILSSSLTDLNNELDHSISSLVAADDETDGTHEEESGNHGSNGQSQYIISDALAKGLSVTVNGASWMRVFIRIDDKLDEAVIIIYGLMPGRHYDIDLGIVHGDLSGNLKQQVTTEDSDHALELRANPDSTSADRSTSSEPPLSTPSTSPSRSNPNAPPTAMPQITFEDRLKQMQNALSVVNAERENLLASLKTARRDSQKADAALRSEIEILKRASEKHVAAEHRAKQKILALQEAVKRAHTATREAEDTVKEVESLVPELNKRKEEKEGEYTKIKDEADRVREERNREGDKEKKRLDAMRSELAALTSKMEKLNGKKDKLEINVIPDLEEQLNEISEEIEQAEIDSRRSSSDIDGMHPLEFDANIDLGAPYMSLLRNRPQGTNNASTQLGRTSMTHIQRPSIGEMGPPLQPPTNSLIQGPSWNLSPRQVHSQTANQTQVHNINWSGPLQQTPTLLVNPQRRPSIKSTTSSTTNNSSPTSLTPSPTATSAIAAPTPSGISSLSSRALAFEPMRTLKSTSGNGSISGFTVPPGPNQKSTIGAAPRIPVGGVKFNTNNHRTGMHGSHDGGRIG